QVDLRTITLVVPPQEVITRDNVPVRVNAVAYFRVVNPTAAIVEVADFALATLQIAQTTLRSVLGQHALDELLSERDKINQILQQIIDEQTAPWGVKVSIVEVRDVEIPTGMQRAMARQAEAERERRNPLTGVPVVVAPGRRTRPGAIGHTTRVGDPTDCPFCAGHEALTPPETLALGRSQDGPDTPGWLVRVVPNKFPAIPGQEV